MTRGMGKTHFLHFVDKTPDEDVGKKKKRLKVTKEIARQEV